MKKGLALYVDLDKRCAECGRAGVVDDTRLCLVCVRGVLTGESMRSEFGRAVQAQTEKRVAADRKRS